MRLNTFDRPGYPFVTRYRVLEALAEQTEPVSAGTLSKALSEKVGAYCCDKVVRHELISLNREDIAARYGSTQRALWSLSEEYNRKRTSRNKRADALLENPRDLIGVFSDFYADRWNKVERRRQKAIADMYEWLLTRVSEFILSSVTRTEDQVDKFAESFSKDLHDMVASQINRSE